MYKRLLTVLILTVLLITCIPVMAQGQTLAVESTADIANEEPVIFEGTITVTEEGGKYDIGFITIHFLKDCLPEDQLPATFNFKIYVKDGEAGIEATPDVEKFLKPVLIKVNKYSGYLYDEDKGENVYVNIKPQVVIAKHFSWYRFR
ncbi:MAG: hypothetical protein ACOYWZ_09605 [Bacillota bacterium]